MKRFLALFIACELLSTSIGIGIGIANNQLTQGFGFGLMAGGILTILLLLVDAVI